MMRSTLFATSFLAMQAVAVLGQEPVTLRVRVVDANTDGAMVAALVEVEGLGRSITGEDGVARFLRVRPGRYDLTASALGYATREASVTVRSDTTIVLDLEPAPLPIDSLNVLVENRRVTLRGWVRGADTRRGVPGAEMEVGGLDVTSGPVGGYRVSVPNGVPLRVDVRSPGYLPWSTEVTLAADERLDIELEVDPVWQRMIARQHERLERRVRRSPHRTRTLERADVLRHGVGQLADVLKYNNIRRFGCVVLDDRVVDSGILWSLLPEEVERVEYIRAGRIFEGLSMVRIYTYDYVRRELMDGRTLVPLVSRICR